MQKDLAQRIHQMFAGAVQQHRGGQLYDAARQYRQILDLDPSHADALHLLGVVALQRGHHEEAVGLIRRAISHNDRVAAFHGNLANALRAQGQLTQAALAFQRALAINADSPDARYNLAVVLQELGRLDEAATAYERLLRATPGHAAARSNLGNVFNLQGRYEEALACFDGALRSQAGFLPALVNRGNVLKLLGRLEEAVQSYRRALDLDPRLAAAHNNLGLAQFEAGRLDEALTSYQNAVSIDPMYAEAHRNLGNALLERGRTADSLAAYRRALSLNRDDAEARLGLAMASVPVVAETVAQSADAPAAFERALAEVAAWHAESPARLAAVVGKAQPFYLAYRPVDVTQALSRYGELMCRAAATPHQDGMLSRVAGEAARERVRMVVVCGHVHDQHPVWEVLLRGILAHLPRERLEVFLYYTGSRVDDETHWARSRVDRFVQGPRSTASWVAEARKDQPDIVFYPEIGMDPVTVALAVLRLAPLQVASWGHPVTTGLPSIDLYVSGELLEPPHAENHYREKLVRLPGTGVCTRAPGDDARIWEGADAGRGVVRFALPHQPIKFDPADDELLAQVAKAAGPCELWIAAPARLGWATEQLRARLAAAFRAQGLDPDNCLRVTPWLTREQFRGFLDAMDVYLDCPAFSGYTTAWQAAHRGLPIVTLEGSFLRQRLAAGLLRQIDAVEGIARSREDYVKLAVQFALAGRDPERRLSGRQFMVRAARKSDGNLAAITTLGRILIEAAGAREPSAAPPQASARRPENDCPASQLG